MIEQICRAPRRAPAGDRARRRPDQGPLPAGDPRPARASGWTCLSSRAARRAAAPADAAGRDRLELRPARACGAAARSADLGVFTGGFTLERRRDGLRPGRARRDRGARRPQPARPLRRSLRDARDRARVRARAARRLRRAAGRPRPPRPRRTSSCWRVPRTGSSAPQVPEWLRALDADHDNLRAALRHASTPATATRRSAWSRPMWRYWLLRGGVSEGRELAVARARARRRAPGSCGCRRQRRRHPRRRAGRLRRGPRALRGGAHVLQRHRCARARRPDRLQPRHPRGLRGRLRDGDRPLRTRRPRSPASSATSARAA